MFLINSNLNHTETFKYIYFSLEVNKKLIDFLGELCNSSCADAFDY